MFSKFDQIESKKRIKSSSNTDKSKQQTYLISTKAGNNNNCDENLKGR